MSNMFKSIVAFLLIAIIIEGCPTIKSRSSWGARNARNKTHMDGNLPYVIIHHTDTPQCNNEQACANRVKSIQNHHMDINGWDDIGYNYLVDQFGLIYEGRGASYRGAHAPNYNSISIGISVIGSYNETVPSTEAIDAIQNLTKCAVNQGILKNDYKLKGHRQVKATDCPGNKFYELIQTWRHWEN